MNISEIEKVVDYIPNLPPKKKHNMKRTSKIIMVLAVLIVSTTLVSAALLSYYGEVATTATVKQSVLLDGNDYTTPVTETIGDACAGCCYCYDHTLENQACIEAIVDQSTTSNSAYNVLFLTDPEDYALDQDDFYQRAGAHTFDIDVSVEFGAGTVTWTIDYSNVGGTITTSGCQLAIGDGTLPVFQVAMNSAGGIQPFYQPYSAGWGTKTALPTGITMTGTVGGTLFVITIDSDFLFGTPCGIYDFYWAMNCETTWSGASDQYVYPPAATDIWTSSVNYKHDESLPFAFPVTLQPGETLDFLMCYEFLINAAPGTYVIDTFFTPVV